MGITLRESAVWWFLQFIRAWCRSEDFALELFSAFVSFWHILDELIHAMREYTSVSMIKMHLFIKLPEFLYLCIKVLWLHTDERECMFMQIDWRSDFLCCSVGEDKTFSDFSKL